MVADSVDIIWITRSLGGAAHRKIRRIQAANDMVNRP